MSLFVVMMIMIMIMILLLLLLLLLSLPLLLLLMLFHSFCILINRLIESRMVLVHSGSLAQSH